MSLSDSCAHDDRQCRRYATHKRCMDFPSNVSSNAYRPHAHISPHNNLCFAAFRRRMISSQQNLSDFFGISVGFDTTARHRGAAEETSAFISSVERLRTQALLLLLSSKVTDSFKASPIAARRMHEASAPCDDHARVALWFLFFFFFPGEGGSESSSITVHNRLRYMRSFQFALLF